MSPPSRLNHTRQSLVRGKHTTARTSPPLVSSANSSVCASPPLARNADSHDFPSGARDPSGTRTNVSCGEHHSPPSSARTPQCNNKPFPSLPRASTASIFSASVVDAPSTTFENAYDNRAVDPSSARTPNVVHFVFSSSSSSSRFSIASIARRVSRAAPLSSSLSSSLAVVVISRLISVANVTNVPRASSTANGPSFAFALAIPRAFLVVSLVVVVVFLVVARARGFIHPRPSRVRTARDDADASIHR